MTIQEEEKIKDLIKQELSFCECENVPFVCANKSTPEGETKMVQLVFDYVLRKNVSISDAIVEVETEFNPNISDNPYV